MSDLIQLLPKDEHNIELERNVRPPEWINPKADGQYNLVVIGAGTAGLVTAAGAAGLGAKVALIEKNLMGGDCLNVGCVPSKALISAARVARNASRASGFGINFPGEVQVDFPKVMERMRSLRAKISPNDSAERFRDLGIDVYFGEGRFIDSNKIQVDGTILRFKKAVLATGARAGAPPISGLEEVKFLTNESVFSLTNLPQRLGVIGAGPIGCELAQTFALFGSEVFIVESMHGVLPQEDPEASNIVKESMERDGVRVLCCGRSTKVERREDGIHLTLESHGESYDEIVDGILVAVGRAPNVGGLGLETVGVEFDPQNGVKVNDRMQTTNPNIYAAGDICSPFKFTHAADFMARIVIQNSLFKGRAKASALTIPWCTYTSPEIAHVGLYEKDATNQGLEIDTFVQKLGDVDRAILEGDDEGIVKVLTRKGSDQIIGGTIVATNAGDMISQITMAMTNGVGLKGIGKTIYPYPTRAEAIRKLGDQYNRGRLTPFVKSVFKKWLAWTR